MADLQLAAKVAKHVKSNAIVYVKDGATVGIGAGQMSRVDSSRVAHRKSMDAAEAAGHRGRADRGLGASRRTRSSRSPTACWRRSRPAPRR